MLQGKRQLPSASTGTHVYNIVVYKFCTQVQIYLDCWIYSIPLSCGRGKCMRAMHHLE
jgi:hypothetical protein